MINITLVYLKNICKMKKNVLKLTCLLLLLPVLQVFAQSEIPTRHNNLKLGFEFGMNVMNGKLDKPEQIRENHSYGYYSRYYYNESDYYDYGFFGDYNDVLTNYFGIKPEYFIYKNRIGIASGVRLTFAYSELSSDRNDYLWRLREDGLNTYYVQIKDIRQNNLLLSIPLEIRFFTNKREFPVQHYFKLGASFNYLIKTETQVNFVNQNMKKYKDEIQNQLPDNQNDFSAFLFGAVGLKIGRFKEGTMSPWGNIELHFPYLLLSNNSFAFNKGMKDNGFPFGVGFQVSFQIPIGKNVPIGSK